MNRSALALIAALGTAHLVLSARQHRQRLTLDAATMHANMLTEITADAESPDTWYLPSDGPREQYVPSIRVNKLVSFLSMKHQVGLIKGDGLRANAEWLMERPDARAYWARWRDHRLNTARGGKDLRFVSALDDAYYDAKEDVDPAA